MCFYADASSTNSLYRKMEKNKSGTKIFYKVVKHSRSSPYKYVNYSKGETVVGLERGGRPTRRTKIKKASYMSSGIYVILSERHAWAYIRNYLHDRQMLNHKIIKVSAHKDDLIGVSDGMEEVNQACFRKVKVLT